MVSGPNDGVFVIRGEGDAPIYCTVQGAIDFLKQHEPVFDWFAFHEAFLATAWKDGTQWRCGEYTVELRYVPCGGGVDAEGMAR